VGVLLFGCISFHGGDKLPSPDPLQAQIDALAARIATLEGQVQGLKAKLKYMSAEGTDAIFEECNVHVRNGLGYTQRAPYGSEPQVNQLGNLIIGYKE
jgi:outer membrane murein-binding lipoprotein Lpp